MSQSENKAAEHAGNLQRATPSVAELRRTSPPPATTAAATTAAAPAPAPVAPLADALGGPPLPAQFLAPAYRGSGKLDGMVAIVTGAEAGIGRAVAILYAREGARLAIIYGGGPAAGNETKQAVEAEGQSCLLLPGDVRDMDFCHAAVQRVLSVYGKIDVLVNNAALQEQVDAFTQLSEEYIDLTLKTNIYGYFHMTKAVLPHLQRGAAIVNTGPVAELTAARQAPGYSSRGTMRAFTLSLASNLMERGIRVNTVTPGLVWPPQPASARSAQQVARFGQDTDMHRPAQPEELSPAYVFLASPACSSYISGIVLPVTGVVGE